MNTEKVMETITIEGAVFEIVDKPRTLYAGYHTTAADVDAMPNNHRNNQVNESNAKKDERDKSADRLHLASILYMSQFQNPTIRLQ